MATNAKKLRSFIKNHKKEEAEKEERKNRSAIEFVQNQVGKNAFFLCPPHENMEGLPFVLRGKHRNCGPEGKTDFMCASCDGKGLKKCPQCVEVKDLYDAGRERDKKRAGKMRRNQRFYWQVIDVKPILDLDKGETLEIPDCLLDHPDEEDKKACKKKGCGKCDWEESCEGGIRAWSVGKKIQEPILDELDDLLEDEDVTNPKAGRPVVVRRKGEEAMNTEYSGIKFLDKIRFPKEVIERIQENLIDLSKVSIPKETEDIKKLMSGVDTEDAEGSDDETPTCFGKYDEDEKDCLKCDFCDPCEVETGSDDDSSKKDKDPDPDDDPDDDTDPDDDPDDDTPESDELEDQLKKLAEKRKKERKAQRTPAPKKE